MRLRNIVLRMGVHRTDPGLPSMKDLHIIIDGEPLISATIQLVVLVEYGEPKYPT
jgi:hypothetical protein